MEDDNKSEWGSDRFEGRMLPKRFYYPGNEEYRRIALIAYLTVFVAVAILMSVGFSRLIHHEKVLGWVDLSFALVLSAILLCHRRTKKSHNRFALYFGIASYGVFIICLFLFSGYDKLTYLWSYIFPLMVFPLAGPRRGMISMLLLIIPLSLLLLFNPFSFMAFYPHDFAFFYIPSLLAVSALSYVYERNRDRTQKRLNEANDALKKSNEEMERRILDRTAELARSEKNYRFLTDRMSDVVWTADMNLDITYVSPSIRSALGYSQEEFKRIPFRDKVTPDSFNRAMTEFAAGLERERTPGISPDRSLQIELEFRHKDSSTVWMELLINPVRDDQGNLVGIHGVSRDITDRKRKEKILRKQSVKLRELSAKLRETEESERRRISRELHDQVGQNLATLGLNLNILQSTLSSGSAGVAQKHVDESLALLEQTAEFIRDMMADLRPPVMDDYGLMAAIRWYGKRFSMRTGIEFILEAEDASPRQSALIEVTLFRIFQEAMTNVLKHAQAKKVEVSGGADKDRIMLTIVDDGVGFDLKKMQEFDEHRGWGLTTMAERAESIGASFSIKSEPGHGTKIIVEVPI